MSVDKVRQHEAQVYGNSLTDLMEELSTMLNSKTVVEQRKKQIRIGCSLKEYVTGARTIIGLKHMFKLTGDFSDMNKIINAVSTQ